MQRMYLLRLPNLRSLSCGSRIAYARQFRGMTQEQLGIALGLRGEKIRNRICRYERDGRIPKGDRLNEIAEILQISEGMLRNYEFCDPTDIVYEMFWLEELLPGFKFSFEKQANTLVDTSKTLASVYDEWQKQQEKLKDKLISQREYIDWKLTYQVERKGGG